MFLNENPLFFSTVNYLAETFLKTFLSYLINLNVCTKNNYKYLRDNMFGELGLCGDLKVLIQFDLPI